MYFSLFSSPTLPGRLISPWKREGMREGIGKREFEIGEIGKLLLLMKLLQQQHHFFFICACNFFFALRFWFCLGQRHFPRSLSFTDTDTRVSSKRKNVPSHCNGKDIKNETYSMMSSPFDLNFDNDSWYNLIYVIHILNILINWFIFNSLIKFLYFHFN